MTADRTMTIGELSQISGLSVSAIRFYQRRGVLPAREGDGGWQRFDAATLDRLALIELAKSAGFSLDEIIRLFDAVDGQAGAASGPTVDGVPVWQGLAAAKLAEIDALAARLGNLRELLVDAMAVGALTADRLRRAPSALGWTAPSEPVRDTSPVA